MIYFKIQRFLVLSSNYRWKKTKTQRSRVNSLRSKSKTALVLLKIESISWHIQPLYFIPFRPQCFDVISNFKEKNLNHYCSMAIIFQTKRFIRLNKSNEWYFNIWTMPLAITEFILHHDQLYESKRSIDFHVIQENITFA